MSDDSFRLVLIGIAVVVLLSSGFTLAGYRRTHSVWSVLLRTVGILVMVVASSFFLLLAIYGPVANEDRCTTGTVHVEDNDGWRCEVEK